VDIVTWYAVIVPAGTPEPIQARLAREYGAVSATEETRAFLDTHGLIYLPNTPAEFAARVAAERARWGRLITERNIRVR
jgi:tripartite-type tricarboxylate transporter receptor subunit TctC